MPNKLLIALAAMVAVLGCMTPNLLRLAHIFDVWKQQEAPLTAAGSACSLFAVDFGPGGFEDVAFVSADSAIACAGGLWELWHRDGPTQRPIRGRCVLISLPPQRGAFPPAIRELRLVGIPEGVALRAHGVSVRGATRVFIVNHGYAHGGERIDAFELDQDALTLTYVGTATSALLQTQFNGILNDVAVVSDSELFVTAFLPEPDNPAGRLVQETVWERTLVPRMYLMALAGRLHTPLLKCVYTLQVQGRVPSFTAGGAATRCAVVADEDFVMANGVVAIPAVEPFPRLVLVADTLGHTLTIFGDRDGYLGRMQRVGSVKLVHAADSIDIDVGSITLSPDGTELSAVLFAGSVVNVAKAARIDRDPAAPSATAATRINISFRAHRGGNVTIASTAQRDLLMLDEWKRFQGGASAVRLRHPSAVRDEEGIVVLGSYMKPGLMVCPMPEY